MPVKINVKRKGAKKATKWTMPVVNSSGKKKGTQSKLASGKPAAKAAVKPKVAQKAKIEQKARPEKKEKPLTKPLAKSFVKYVPPILAAKKSAPAPIAAKKSAPISSPKVSAKTIEKLTQKTAKKVEEKRETASEKRAIEQEAEEIAAKDEKEERASCDSAKNVFCQDEEKEEESTEEREIEESFGETEKKEEKKRDEESVEKKEEKQEQEHEKKKEEEENQERDINQVSLTDFTNPEDVDKLFLDITTETEKGEAESSLEALVTAAKNKLPGDIKERCVIEAALFMSAKPLSVPDLAKLTGIAAIGYVENEVKALASEYEQRGSAILVANEEGKYIMRLKPAYLQFVKEFTQEGELSRLALKVLAYIAKTEGILKSTLVKRIGTTVYEGVGELVEKGFVEQRRSGRSSSLRTTPKFKEYFSQ